MLQVKLLHNYTAVVPRSVTKKELLPLFRFMQYVMVWAVGETRAEGRNVKMTGTSWKYSHC
jgi:hypothetical protein